MAEPTPTLAPPPLHGRRLLVVEDEYMIAMDMAQALEDLGAEVVGPAASVEDALLLVREEGGRLDAALLDINLQDRRVFPVADALAERGVPFVFATGYDAAVIPTPHAATPRCEKPVNKAGLAGILARILVRPPVGHEAPAPGNSPAS